METSYSDESMRACRVTRELIYRGTRGRTHVELTIHPPTTHLPVSPTYRPRSIAHA